MMTAVHRLYFWLACQYDRIRLRGSAHDRHWRAHPAVATDAELTFGQRAADVMKGVFATWRALGIILLFMAIWIASGGFAHDGFPFILLNLCLSCLAALQCFILLIAAKRADQIAAQIALHTLQNTESIKQLIEQNTALTQALHDHILVTTGQDTTHAADDADTPNAPDPAALAQAGARVARRSRSSQQQRRIRT